MSAHPAEVVEVVADAMVAATGDYVVGATEALMALANLRSAGYEVVSTAAVPGLSDLLAGRSRVVPVGLLKEGAAVLGAWGRDAVSHEALLGMSQLVIERINSALAASPYAAAQPGAGGGDV